MRNHRRTLAVLAGLVAPDRRVHGRTTPVDTAADPARVDIKKIDALDGVTITVGSKEFDEQLAARPDRDPGRSRPRAPRPRTRPTSPDRTTCRAALTKGDIDVYWEYTGTAWVSYLEQDQAGRRPGEAV